MSSAQHRRQQERANLEHEQEAQQSLQRRASAITAIAQIMVDQNEKMLAGLRAVAEFTDSEPPAKVDYIARNVASVGPNRPSCSRKEQALLARAEVMAAATSHLGSGGSSASRPTPTRVHSTGTRSEAHTDSSSELVRAAREEIERGMDITAFETQTRRPRPSKLSGLQRSSRQLAAGRGGGTH